MRISIILALFCGLFIQIVFGQSEYEVKKGRYPYMAFLYFPDDTVVDSTGERFFRGAVLIKEDRLLSASMDRIIGFPEKTLLARLGAVAIDSKFTLNEDEDEQEREVVQIIRPANSDKNVWWRTDISILKTLLPFNTTPMVAPTTIHFSHNFVDKHCAIPVFVKKSSSDEKALYAFYVELLLANTENCGPHFHEDTMTCGGDADDSKNIPSDFCEGNSGAPLICEDEVAGLQTYIENECRQPHLYQQLSKWKDFVTCGMEENCNGNKCENVCSVTDKDEDLSKTTISTSTSESETEPEVRSEATEVSKIELSDLITDDITESVEITNTTTSNEESTTTSTEKSNDLTRTPLETSEKTTIVSAGDDMTSIEPSSNVSSEKDSKVNPETTTTWVMQVRRKENYDDSTRSNSTEDNITSLYLERKTNLEARVVNRVTGYTSGAVQRCNAIGGLPLYIAFIFNLI